MKNDNPQILKGWYAHALPNELLKYVKTKFLSETKETPAVVLNKKQGWKSSAKDYSGPFINWDLFPFLKVQFLNKFKPVEGYLGAGDGKHQPFQQAATVFYFYKETMTGKEIFELCIDFKNHDQDRVKHSWIVNKADNLIEEIKNNSDDCKPTYNFLDYCNIL